MAWARRRPRQMASYDDRPPGFLIWIHVTRAARLPALLQLATRLMSQRADTNVLFTVVHGVTPPRRLNQGILHCVLPGPHPLDALAFLNHWQPDLCLWTSGDLCPSLVVTAAEAGLPLYLIDATEDGFSGKPVSYLPNPTLATLSYFSVIMASDANASRRLKRIGVSESELTITGPLQEGGAALPCDDTDLEDLRTALGTRPVWLAAMVQPEELGSILRAHRIVSRFAQRLLLVVVPDRPDMGDDMAARLEGASITFCRWSHGEFPDENIEILLADTYGEMGLWYRLAPISFMASSLVSGHGGCDPFEPAALGSAILYGPNSGRHLHAYSRLAEAGAARIVRDTDTLASALKQLVAPDRAAAMSLAAWEVVSEGALVTDRIMDLIHDTLDLAEGT